MEDHKRTCKQCGGELSGPYCASCGRPETLRRINGSYVLSEVSSILTFDKGILYTIRELLLRPGVAIRTFINDERSRLVKPIVFVILTSLVYSLAHHYLQFEDGYVNYGSSEPTATLTIFAWIQSNYGYSNLIMALFIALWAKVLYRKHHYNYFEILIMLCFVMGMLMLIVSLFGIVDGLLHVDIMQIGAFAAFVYSAWAIGQFYETRKVMGYFKALFVYIFGMVTFLVGAVVLGMVVDAISR